MKILERFSITFPKNANGKSDPVIIIFPPFFPVAVSRESRYFRVSVCRIRGIFFEFSSTQQVVCAKENPNRRGKQEKIRF